MKPPVGWLNSAQREEAVDVLCAAFRDYPVMRYVLSDAGEAYASRLRSLTGFFCDKRLTRGWPLLGIRDSDETLVAVAGVNLPGDTTMPPSLRDSLDSLRSNIGAGAVARLDAYEEESGRDSPEEPHHFLGIIGVRPDRQASGCGRTLIEEIASIARSDPSSAGICLNTETASNVPFYRHLGFEVIAERDIGAIHTWCMFRRTRPAPG